MSELFRVLSLQSILINFRGHCIAINGDHIFLFAYDQIFSNGNVYSKSHACGIICASGGVNAGDDLRHGIENVGCPGLFLSPPGFFY